MEVQLHDEELVVLGVDKRRATCVDPGEVERTGLLPEAPDREWPASDSPLRSLAPL